MTAALLLFPLRCWGGFEGFLRWLSLDQTGLESLVLLCQTPPGRSAPHPVFLHGAVLPRARPQLAIDGCLVLQGRKEPLPVHPAGKHHGLNATFRAGASCLGVCCDRSSYPPPPRALGTRGSCTAQMGYAGHLPAFPTRLLRSSVCDLFGNCSSVFA